MALSLIQVNLSRVDDDTLAHKDRDGLKILMFKGVKIIALLSFRGRGLRSTFYVYRG